MPTLSDSIYALCAKYDRNDAPGIALAVTQNGTSVYRKTFGLASLEHDVPITPKTVFETASVSKQVTAFAIHLLAKDNVLSLEDDVRQHVPDLPDFGTTITIRHCLHHTCGLREWGDAMGLAGRLREDVFEPELVHRWLTRQQALNHAPGAEFLYSNTGYFVLAAVVTATSGKSFATFCRDRIFDPLGMTDTHFRETLQAVIKHQAQSYYREDDGTFVPCLSNQALPGATSMQSTIDDMVLWLANLDSGRVGGRAMLDEMHQSGVLNTGQETRYGSGLEFGTYRGETIIFHSGGWACYCSLTMRVPSKGLAIVVLSNTCEMNVYDFWPSLIDLFFEGRDEGISDAAPQQNAAPLPASQADLTGLYVGPGGPVIEISQTGDDLFTGPVNADSVKLTALGGLRLRPAGQSDIILEFHRAQTGEISGYSVQQNGMDLPFRSKIQTPAANPDLVDFEGTFFSSELGVAYTVSVLDGVLNVASIIWGNEPLRHVSGDLFIAGDQAPVADVYQFDRNSSGKVTTLFIGNSDARHQRFDRIQSNAQ